MVAITNKIDYGAARTLEAKIIRDLMRARGHKGDAYQIWKQLEQARLRNKNRERKEENWVWSDVFKHLKKDKIGDSFKEIEH